MVPSTVYQLTNQFLGDQVALDAIGGGKQPAMKPTMPGNPVQQWIFTGVGNGYFRIQNLACGTGVALEGGAKDQGALMNGRADQSGQMWKVNDAGNGYVTLSNMFTEADGYTFEGGALNGGALITPGGHSGQNWKLTPIAG